MNSTILISPTTSPRPANTMPVPHSSLSIRSKLPSLSVNGRKHRSSHEDRPLSSNSTDKSNQTSARNSHRSLLSRSWAAATTVIRKKTTGDEFKEITTTTTNTRFDSGTFSDPNIHRFASQPVTPPETSPIRPRSCSLNDRNITLNTHAHNVREAFVSDSAVMETSDAEISGENARTTSLPSSIQAHEATNDYELRSLDSPVRSPNRIASHGAPIERLSSPYSRPPTSNQRDIGTTTPASSIVMDAISRVIPAMPSIPSTLKHAYNFTGLGLTTEEEEAEEDKKVEEYTTPQRPLSYALDGISIPFVSIPASRKPTPDQTPKNSPGFLSPQTPIPLQPEAIDALPTHKINWESAARGLKLLDSSLAEARQDQHNMSSNTDSSGEASFSRQLYVRGMGHLLAGMPDDLSPSEYHMLRNYMSSEHRRRLALPNNGNDMSVSGVRPNDWLSWTTTALSGENSSGEKSAFLDRPPSFLHQITAITVLHLCYLINLLLPIAKLVFSRLFRYERENRMAERLVLICFAICNYSLATISRVASMQDGQVGQLGAALMIWLIRSLFGGLNEGLTLGLGVLYDGQLPRSSHPLSPATDDGGRRETSGSKHFRASSLPEDGSRLTNPYGNGKSMTDSFTPSQNIFSSSVSSSPMPSWNSRVVSVAPPIPSFTSFASLYSFVFPGLTDRNGQWRG